MSPWRPINLFFIPSRPFFYSLTSGMYGVATCFTTKNGPVHSNQGVLYPRLLKALIPKYSALCFSGPFKGRIQDFEKGGSSKCFKY